MFIEAKLVFQSYMPRRLEKGMLFQRKVSMRKLKTNIEYKEVFELKDIPRDTDSYVSINGWPVEPYIYSITANPDDHAIILAKPEVIGWWDDEPDAVYEEDAEDQGTLRDIEVKDFNYALENYEGNIDIQVYDDEFKKGIVRPVIYMEKVTLSIPMEKSFEPDEESDDDDYEDWDDLDDLTDYDNPEWPNDHPKDKTDNDPE
jgi:hypothetical protein